ncbi:Uncharacterised protein [Mycobacteroides abscessus subsp. abscessus]|nr:Uncharacterised protein [Mycobacteroides abscessus subsp. abscessus]
MWAERCSVITARTSSSTGSRSNNGCGSGEAIGTLNSSSGSRPNTAARSVRHMSPNAPPRSMLMII